jgi:hypothetical protein
LEADALGGLTCALGVPSQIEHDLHGMHTSDAFAVARPLEHAFVVWLKEPEVCASLALAEPERRQRMDCARPDEEGRQSKACEVRELPCGGESGCCVRDAGLSESISHESRPRVARARSEVPTDYRLGVEAVRLAPGVEQKSRPNQPNTPALAALDELLRIKA